jgi:hypothetical protein
MLVENRIVSPNDGLKLVSLTASGCLSQELMAQYRHFFAATVLPPAGAVSVNQQPCSS